MIDQCVKELSIEHRLSGRETDVLKCLASGLIRADEIGKHFGISQNTARIHIKNINTKFRTRSKSEIMYKLIDHLDKKF